MQTELTDKTNGIWSPFAHMKWYRKRCDKLHKKYQELRLQERLAEQIESFVEKLTATTTTQNLIPDVPTTAVPTRRSNLRLY